MTWSFIVFGAELPWVQPLAAELGRFGPTVGISLGASHPFARRRSATPFDDPSGRLELQLWTYPPGFNGKLSRLFVRAIRHRVDRVARRLGQEAGAPPYVVTPYPEFARYLTNIDPERLIYLNYDDYSVDVESGGDTPAIEEAVLIDRAGTVVCNSQYQTLRFQSRFPKKAQRIFHLPHGVHPSFINPDPSVLTEPNTVCSVGYLSSRYDWDLIYDVARSLPDIRFSFVGDIVTRGNNGPTESWLRRMDDALGLPNVAHTSGIRHRDTPPFYWTSAANWMPYKVDLGFVKASCPLKLTDGLASGRTIVSADVPECRLYPDWIRVYRRTDDAVQFLRAAVDEAAQPAAADRSAAQLEFARRNTWATRAATLIASLPRGERVGALERGEHSLMR